MCTFAYGSRRHYGHLTLRVKALFRLILNQCLIPLETLNLNRKCTSLYLYSIF